MRRVIKRVIKTEITEIWTISWIDQSQAAQTDSTASEAVESPRKAQASSACDRHTPCTSDMYDDNN